MMTITTAADILADRGEKLCIPPTHNNPDDTTAHERLSEALSKYMESNGRVWNSPHAKRGIKRNDCERRESSITPKVAMVRCW
jgi:hypothetical protein